MLFKYQIHRLILSISIFILLLPTVSLGQTNDQVLVRVNDTPITRRDLQIEVGMLSAEMELRNHPLSNNQLAELSRQLLENLIRRELLYQRAQQKKIKIQNRWVQKAIAEFKAKITTKPAYANYLKKATLDHPQFKTRIKKGLIVRRLLRREVIRSIKVSEAEIQAFFRKHPDFFQRREQIRIRHIMILANAQENISQRAAALLRIQTIQQKLLEGNNFAALAMDYSEDNSRANGGDLGYLERGHLIKPIADAAFALNPGQVSDIIESRLGYHIIQLVDKSPSSQLAYRNTRSKIERTLRRNKENIATEKYMTKLMKKASIQRIVHP